MLPILPIRTQELLKGTTRDLMDRPRPNLAINAGNQRDSRFPLPEDLDLKGDEKKSGTAGRREGMTEEGECVLGP